MSRRHLRSSSTGTILQVLHGNSQLAASTGSGREVTATSRSSLWKQSDTDLFLRNLRLLDLDKNSDWPDLTSAVFSQKHASTNQRHRIQCVEWALFRLFEIWDPQETRMRLQPFFPPLEPLQSLNLRAALFRALTGLKKAGVLGRDTVLRKTILDDCKGDRIEEILMVFSFAVLRKQAYSSGSQQLQPSIVQHFCNSHDLGDDAEKAQALLLAYEATLRINEGCKKKLGAQVLDMENLLGLKEREMHRRETKVEGKHSDATKVRAGADWNRNEDVLGRLQQARPADSLFANSLVHGHDILKGDPLVEMPFEEVWRKFKEGTFEETKREKHSGDIFALLNKSLHQCEENVRSWRDFRKHIACGNLSPHNASKGNDHGLRNHALRLHLHQGIHPGRELEVSTVDVEEKSRGYQDMVAALKKDLADVKPSSTPRTVPLRSYSQRVRTSELSLKMERPQNGDVGHRNVFSDLEETSEPREIVATENIEAPATQALAKDSEDGAGKMDREQRIAVARQRERPVRNTRLSLMDEESQDLLTEQMIVEAAAGGASPDKPRHQSLSERTRASMAFQKSSSEKAQRESGVQSLGRSQDPSSPDEIAKSHTVCLSDRTRMSLSSFTKLQPTLSNKHKQSCRSPSPTLPSYPRNPFSTSAGPLQEESAMAAEENPETLPGPGAVTPREELFEQDADYASVFKSRPKIALSPPSSPVRHADLNADAHEANYDDDDDDTTSISFAWADSPLKGR